MVGRAEAVLVQVGSDVEDAWGILQPRTRGWNICESIII